MTRMLDTAVVEWKSTAEGACLHELFEMQVDERPTKPALVCRDECYTYEELERRSNQLARHLRGYDIGPGKLVGIYFDRSERPIVAILAVLKAGAGYVPIDPVYPVERAKHILAEADVGVLLTEQELATKASSFFAGPVISLDDGSNRVDEESAERLSREETGVSPDDLCYVLYTSGTTGRPKGVMTEHRNVVRFTASFNEANQVDHTDRVFQGFSLGFDGSVEEMWMAFSNGGTLVVGTSDVVKFGDEVARLFEREQVTVFSTVPTFLSLISQDPRSLRLVIVSGEPCPPDIVQKWARPGRRLLNVYGPTETTVNTTVAECLPDKPVTIGRPLRGYETHVLNEHMQPVAPGEPGELYIGGVGVARGYFNQPELTQRQFVPSPFNGTDNSHRLYRTGDLVCTTEEGDLQFLRRIDRQVKIRGFRIELSEIESVLREHGQIRQAVVNVCERDGLKEIAAYVVSPCTNGSFDRDDVLQWLRNRLPPYMVPAYLDVIDVLPTLASGKADRSRLPKPNLPLVSSKRSVVAPKNKTEQQICTVWEKLLKISPISCEDNFFLDLGGYSLLAAEMVSSLRSQHGLEVAIRDVYEHPTIQQLAKHVETNAEVSSREDRESTEQPQRRSSREVFESLPRLTRWTCVGLQAVTLGCSYGIMSLPLLILILLTIGFIQGVISITTFVVTLIALIFLTLPAAISFAIVVKWLVIGRYRPGAYPVWGMYYFRWWLVSRVQAISGIGRYAGSPIMSLVYRLMGAKVGKRCLIDTSLCAIYDLVTIGDETCIGAQTQLLGYRVEDGMLLIGSIEIGDRCFVGVHSALGLNTKMGDGAKLDDLSLLADGTEMKPGESRAGSPAEPAEVTLPEIDEENATHGAPFLFGMFHFLASEVVGELLLLTIVPLLLTVIVTYLYAGLGWAIVSVFLAAPVNVALYCLIVAGIKALILRRTEPGVYPVESLYYLRKWAVDLLLSDSSRFASMVYTTIYFPLWLRLLGAKIGKRAEISTVTLMTPDLMVIDDESFFADGSMIGGRRLYRGHVQLEYNHIGRRSFVGNNALLPVGAELGDNCLLGVVSVPPGGVGAKTPDETEWLGSPPFQLPFRQKVGGFDASETYHPTIGLYLLRMLIDGLRIVLPVYVGVTALLAYVFAATMSFLYLPLWQFLLVVPVISFAVAFGVAMTVVAIKRVLMGTFEPVIKPLWSPYVWLNEVVNGVYEGVGVLLMSPLMGTPFFSWYLRMMGCKVGKRCFLETGLFSEFDLVEIGDYAALNMGVVVQNHLFEDRIMKSSYLRIGEECSVGNMSVVLYDSEMQRGSSIGSLSLLMKGETLPPNTRWIGIPTKQVNGQGSQRKQ